MDAGLEALEAMRSARRYNAWLFRRIAPYLGDRVIEAGAGIGVFSHFLLDRERLVLLDGDPRYVEMLRDEFGSEPNVRVVEADLAHLAAWASLRDQRPDTVLCMNVLEHIEQDGDVLRGFHDVLAPGGRAVVLVPNGPWLYGTLDRGVGHVRRYSRAGIARLMADAGFEVEALFGLNRLAAPAWFVNGRVLRRKAFPAQQVKMLDSMLPLVRLTDLWLPCPALSLVAVGRKGE